MTVYEFAKKCMTDKEFNAGSPMKDEKKYLDAVGFDYKAEGNQILSSGEDLAEFYHAMYILWKLNNKYRKD